MMAFAFLAAVILIPALLGFVVDALMYFFLQFMGAFKEVE